MQSIVHSYLDIFGRFFLKRMFSVGFGTLLFSPFAFAVTSSLSGPVPALSQSYGAGITSTVIYTITNSLPNPVSVNVSGISGGIIRTTVENDCGQMALGSSSCNIGIAITPTSSQIGTSISQTLNVSLNGKKPLTSKIAFQVSNAYAYIANYYNSSVTKCMVDPITGLFNTCQDSGVGGIFSGPVQIIMRSFGGNKFAYVSNITNSTILRCNVNPVTGQFSSCVDSGAGTQLSAVWGMSFYDTSNGNTYMYVPNPAKNQIFQCPINTTTGLLGTCVDSGAGAVFPGMNYVNAASYIKFNSSGGNTYVYVTEGNNGSVYVTKCLVNFNSGTFSNCSNLNVGFPGPTGIAFTKIGNQSTAYITNAYNTVIYTCTVDSQGLLNCANPIPGGWSELTQAKIGGQTLLYSANGFGTNNVSQCLIDPNTGALSACQDSGVSSTPFSAPFSIVFF